MGVDASEFDVRTAFLVAGVVLFLIGYVIFQIASGAAVPLQNEHKSASVSFLRSSTETQQRAPRGPAWGPRGAHFSRGAKR